MRRWRMPLLVLSVAFWLVSPPQQTRAAINADGDVIPTDPTTWTDSTSAYIGNAANGSVAVDEGSAVSSKDCYIGYSSGANGEVSLTGAGSTWTIGRYLQVGVYGNGSLMIGNAGAVTVGYSTIVANSSSTSSGTINFGDGGGMLTTKDLHASPGQLLGTGTISTRGLVSDVDLVFDSTHGLTRLLNFNSLPDQNISVNFDMSDPSANGDLGVGYRSNGSLAICDGVTVNSRYGFVGAKAGATGEATVDGAGSTWATSSEIFVGFQGAGTLNITRGGTVSSSGRSGAGGNRYTRSFVNITGTGSTWTNSGELIVTNATINVSDGGVLNTQTGRIGRTDFPQSIVTIEGSGSKWTNTGDLYVADDFSWYARLNIAGGGTVTAQSVSVYGGTGSLAIDVGTGSNLTVAGGTGTITNTGTVWILAGPGATPSEMYYPISADTWSGTGAYKGIGGTWNTSTHAFTASQVEPGAAGSPVNIDLITKQRVRIDDSATGSSLGASFLASTKSKSVTFSATPIDGTALTSLESLLDPSESLLAGWQCSVSSGFAFGDLAYLSFNIGADHPADNLSVWHYDGTAWTSYDASDLTYDGTWASFTVTGFSGYAVTTPEPSTLALLAAASFCAIVLTRRRWPE